MMRISLAVWTFFRILFNGGFARKIESLYLEEARLVQPPAAPAPQPEIKPPEPVSRSEALTLLSLLQREGRLVDFLKEPLESYTDAQIGAAVRDIHRDCSSVVERVFGISALSPSGEGSTVTVEPGFNPEHYRLSGNVAGLAPYRGVLRHPGWIAVRCELPIWQGTPDGALVVAPAEVEIV